MKDTSSIADPKIIGAVTHNKGILHAFEPLKKSSGPLTPSELDGVAGHEVLVGARWGFIIPLSAPTVGLLIELSDQG